MQLAEALNVPAPRSNDVVRERRGVSADTAMCLARYFGSDARPGINLQTAYDLRIAEITNARRIPREIPPCRRAEHPARARLGFQVCACGIGVPAFGQHGNRHKATN